MTTASSNPTVALIADLHFGEDYGTKKGSLAPELLRDAIEQMAAFEPDLLIDLGDRLNDESAEVDAERLQRLADVFAAVDAPRAHLVGNHDLVHLDREAAERILGTPMHSYSMDLGGWHLAFWNADCTYPGLELPAEDLAWLEQDLAATTLPTAVFAHVPVGGGSTIGNYYFEERPEGRATYENAAAARTILCASDTCKIVFAGHQHWNALHTVDGVHFVTIPSVIETFATHPEPARSWALVELGDLVRVRVFGEDPREYSLPVRRDGEHWLRRS